MSQPISRGSETSVDLECPSRAMQRAYAAAGRAARTDLDILLVGEPGAGKATLARRIYRESDRAALPFLVLQPASPGALWSEGPVPGGNDRSFAGLGPAVDPGATLFIPELTELDPRAQAEVECLIRDPDAWLRQPLKAVPPRPRVIAATSGRPDWDVKSGRLRNGLALSLGAITIVVPPLRERQSDLVPLLEHFYRRTGADGSGPEASGVPHSWPSLLTGYHWPGNVEQLREVAYELSRTGSVPPGLLPGLNRRTEAADWIGGRLSLAEAARLAGETVEKRLITQALEGHDWNRKLASERLNISYRVLLDKMRRLEIC